MAFNPILETNIQPTQAVQKPSAAGAAVNLLGGLFPERAAPPTPSRADVTDSFRQETLRAMETARQAGDTAGINNAYRNWSVQQGVGTAPEIDSAFEAYTGRSPMIATTGGDTTSATLRESPDYTLGYELARNSNPNQSPEDLDLAGINYASSKAAVTARIESFKQRQDLTWTEVQVTYDEGFNLAVKTARDMAASINADNVITPVEAQQFRSFFATEMEKFDAPPGIDPTTWDTYSKQKMGAFNDLVNTQLNNLMSDGPSKDMPKAMQNLFDKLVTQGKLPAGIMYAVSGGGSNQAALDTMLQMFAGGDESWADKIIEVSNMSFDELLAYSKTFEETGVETFQDAVSVEEINKWAKQPDTEIVSSLVDNRANVSSADPMITTLAVQAIVEKVNTLEGKSLDGDLLKRTFDTAYMSALERIKAKNPALGEYFIARTTEVLKAQQSAMLNNINSVAATNGFEIRTVNGKPEFLPREDLLSDAAKAELDKYFGGSMQRAWDANGRAMGETLPGTVAALATPELFGRIKAIKGLQESLGKYAAVMATVDRIAGVKPVEAGTPESNDNNGTQVGSTVVEAGAGYTVIQMADGNTVRREGTRAWRNNNPGNIEYGDFAKRNGAIGTDGRFAVFPTVEDGRRARASLLFESPNYKNLTIGEAIARYAPSFENDTNGYTNAITSALGLPASTKLSDLGPDERAVMQNAMERVEGFTPGKENGVQSYDTAQANPRQTMAGTPATGPFVPMASSQPFVPQDYTPSQPMAPTPTAPVMGTSNTPPVVDRGYQPATMTSPEATPQAVAAPYDADVQSFLDTVRNGYEAAKSDKALQFNSAAEVEAAKAEGKVKEGDVVMIKGKPVVVW